jgi:site-specific DNA-methyltransferase (cytosine-N4-specific)
MTHGFHPYPARLIPQIARKLIDMFATTKKDVVLDPYCGSETVLVEAKSKGIRSIGIDANPLASLIAKVRTTPIEPERLKEESVAVNNKIKNDLPIVETVELPSIKNS